jgi:transposase
MLQAVADGETNPVALAACADTRLRATPEPLRDALGACADLHAVSRRLVKMALDDLTLLETQIQQLDQESAAWLRPSQDAVGRLARVPGLGVDSAQQIIAELGPTAATFPAASNLASWVGACPGTEESADEHQNPRSPKGNRPMRRLLNQAANAAIKTTGSLVELLYRRYVPRLGHHHTIAVIAHRLCRVVWTILHEGVHYHERGPAVNERSQQRRTARMIRTLRNLGYRVEFSTTTTPVPA